MEEIILAKGTKEEKYESLFPQLEALWAGEDDLIANMVNTVAAIKQVFDFHWVGFYFANNETKTLHLGPYIGAATDHTIIPFGKGICGQVAVSNENFVVPDVQAQDNYIACSFKVKSEIVVPLFVNGENIGQIDIDSNVLDPFTAADERFLEFVNSEIAKLFK